MSRTALMSFVTAAFCSQSVVCLVLTLGLIAGSVLCIPATTSDASEISHHAFSEPDRDDAIAPEDDDTSSDYYTCPEEDESQRDSGRLSTSNYQVLELCLECFKLVPNPILRVLKRACQTKRHGTLTFAVLYQRDLQPANGHRQRPNSNSNSSTSSTPDDNQWKQIGHTEIVSHCNRDCRFVTKFNVPCGAFEERTQPLRVEVYQYIRQRTDLRARNMVGAAEFSADDILSDSSFRKKFMLNSSRAQGTGCLQVSGNPIQPPSPNPNAKKILLDVALSPSNTKGIYAAFYVLCRQLPNGDYTAVYRSEVIGRGTQKFERMIKDVNAVNGGGADDTLLRLELYQFSGKGKHTQLGFVQMSLEKLSGTAIGQPLTWLAHNRLSFVDRFVRGGWSSAMRQMDIGQIVLVKKSVDMGRSKYALSVC